MTQHVVSNPPSLSRTSGPYPSLNKARTLAERLEVTPTIQTVKPLEQHFLEFNVEVRTQSNYNHDKEYDSDVDIDMSQSVTSHKPAQTETNIDNLSSSELFELCSALDSLETESNDSNKENQVLTLEYHSSPTVEELLQELGENTVVQEITDM